MIYSLGLHCLQLAMEIIDDLCYSTKPTTIVLLSLSTSFVWFRLAADKLATLIKQQDLISNRRLALTYPKGFFFSFCFSNWIVQDGVRADNILDRWGGVRICEKTHTHSQRDTQTKSAVAKRVGFGFGSDLGRRDSPLSSMSFSRRPNKLCSRVSTCTHVHLHPALWEVYIYVGELPLCQECQERVTRSVRLFFFSFSKCNETMPRHCPASSGHEPCLLWYPPIISCNVFFSLFEGLTQWIVDFGASVWQVCDWNSAARPRDCVRHFSRKHGSSDFPTDAGNENK